MLHFQIHMYEFLMNCVTEIKYFPLYPYLKNQILTFCQTTINHVQQEKEQELGAVAHGLAS